MPKSYGQKLKILYLMDILNKYTDENHHITMPEIIKKLSEYGINAERKSIYSDIEALNSYGMDIICEKTNTYGYYVANRYFELPELKLLVDSVHASKFITEKKSKLLIKKLEKLTNVYNANELFRQVYISEKVKTMNEKSYYNVDIIHNAIANGQKISFKYYTYNVNKEKEYKNDGKKYIVSPYSLTYSDENYYLISYYKDHSDTLTHFRVDRMTNIIILNEKAENLNTIMPKNFSISEYSKNIFSMFNGDTKRVTVKCDNSIINQIIDRFGTEVYLRKYDENSFIASFDVVVSPTFFGWIFTFEGKIQIVSPSFVVDQFNKTLQTFTSL